MAGVKSLVTDLWGKIKGKIAPKPKATEMPEELSKLMDSLTEDKRPLSFRLLTEDEIRFYRPEVLNKYGRDMSPAPTDLALLLGGNQTDTEAKTDEGSLTGSTWTMSPARYGEQMLCLAPYYNILLNCDQTDRSPSIRPVLEPETTAALKPTQRKTGINGVDIVEYGEYPQTVADETISRELEQAFQEKTLKNTGKNYTFDKSDQPEDPFKPDIHPEYEYEGKKYVRVLSRVFSGFDNNGTHKRLSDGRYVEQNQPYWVEVKPIEWLVDKTGLWIAKNALISGIQFFSNIDFGRRYGEFQDSFMKKYLDTYFSHEMGHEEMVSERVLTGLSAWLAAGEDLETIKKTIKPARTPERTEELARITRMRRFREILSKSAHKAQEMGDKALVDKIVKLSGPYSYRYIGMLNRVERRHALHRAKRKQGDRG